MNAENYLHSLVGGPLAQHFYGASTGESGGMEYCKLLKTACLKIDLNGIVALKINFKL